MDSHWTGFANLQVNLVYPTKWAWGPATDVTFEEYLEHLGDTIGVVLEKGCWDPDSGNSDSIPYLVNYHAHGQYNQLQVDWDYPTALGYLLQDGSGYYFFFPDAGARPYSIGDDEFLLCKKDSCTSSTGLFVSGCDETESGDPLYEPKLDFGDSPGMFGYYDHGRTLVNRFRAAIGNSQELNASDTVLMYDMNIRDVNGSWTPHPYYLTKGQFPGDLQPAIFSMELTVSPTYSRTAYKFYTWNQCDVYVDWVEYMDKEQAYPLVWNATTRAAACSTIKWQTDSLLRRETAYSVKR